MKVPGKAAAGDTYPKTYRTVHGYSWIGCSMRNVLSEPEARVLGLFC